jgi:hypothetical protein
VFAGGDQAAWANEAALMGGLLALTAHTAKTTTRAAANTSPEPLSNLLLSLVDDVAAPTMLWLAGTSPWLFAIALVLVLAVMIGVTVMFFRFLRGLLARVRGGRAATG